MSGKKSFNAGIRAEARAIKYFISIGYKIIGERVRTQTTEVDIVATDNEYLVFTEVKFAKSISEASYRVDQRKKERMIMAAEQYIESHPEIYQKHPFIRFDVVLLSEGEILHHQNAFSEE